MPNHIINELIFRDLDAGTEGRLLAAATHSDGLVDFSILLPLPINFWPGNVGTEHTRRFPGTHLDAARTTWGTKWNAYGQKGGAITREPGVLTLTFQTAWSPPMGWLAALASTLKFPFEHNWLDEGATHGWAAKFDFSDLDDWKREAWSEKPASPEMQRHLHKLLWGVEEFEDDDALPSEAGHG